MVDLICFLCINMACCLWWVWIYCDRNNGCICGARISRSQDVCCQMGCDRQENEWSHSPAYHSNANKLAVEPRYLVTRCFFIAFCSGARTHTHTNVLGNLSYHDTPAATHQQHARTYVSRWDRKLIFIFAENPHFGHHYHLFDSHICFVCLFLYIFGTLCVNECMYGNILFLFEHAMRRDTLRDDVLPGAVTCANASTIIN